MFLFYRGRLARQQKKFGSVHFFGLPRTTSGLAVSLGTSQVRPTRRTAIRPERAQRRAVCTVTPTIDDHVSMSMSMLCLHAAQSPNLVSARVGAVDDLESALEGRSLEQLACLGALARNGASGEADPLDCVS